jgi:hypothetical protein
MRRSSVGYTVGSVQRSIAFILCALITWLVVLPLLLPSAESVLPECCRRNGKHHCVMVTAESANAAPAFTTIKAKCPYCPAIAISTQAHAGTISMSAAIFAGLVQHPAVSPQIEASYRISHDRARQKRGPPSSLLA